MVQMQTSSQSELKTQVIDTFVYHIVHKQQSLNLLHSTLERRHVPSNSQNTLKNHAKPA